MNSLNRLPERMNQKQFSCALRAFLYFFNGIEKEIQCKEDIKISEDNVSIVNISES